MDVFKLRDRLISDYSSFITSFIQIKDDRIKEQVDQKLNEGFLWPDALIQLNPSFEPGERIDRLVSSGILHPECLNIFRKDKSPTEPGQPLQLFQHQEEAIRIALKGHNYVLTTGTGSGKSLAYIIPIVDSVLKAGTGRGVKAIIVYPMNALANSQLGELDKFLCQGYPEGRPPVTFARYTGQESEEQKQAVIDHPPDILLTNYVMLELMLTRPQEIPLIAGARNLKFLVFDELHTYRGRQGSDVALLIRRAREAFSAPDLQLVGTSATLGGEGTFKDQQEKVSRVASLIFGSQVQPEHVIGETLRRATPENNLADPEFVRRLGARLENYDSAPPPASYPEFIADPLSIWIESTFGIRREGSSNRLIRQIPVSITGTEGAAYKLSDLTDLPAQRCVAIIERHLLASYLCAPNPETGFPVFAFRLHQFISRGDTVYASLEEEGTRHLTFQGQQFVPGAREKILLPLVFCRECGQEYYSVRLAREEKDGPRSFIHRELSDRLSGENDEAGFIYLNTKSPWPEDESEVLNRVPDDWLEEHRGSVRIRKHRRKNLPRPVRLAPNGTEDESGLDCSFLSAPFRFCLNCGVAYDFRQSSDYGKLSSLATEGRSTATTILSLSTILYLRREADLAERARKLLSFTDNRQDAALQAGHFNDFIEVGLLRSAIYRAVSSAPGEHLRHDLLVQRVFDALDLPLELYANDPDVRFRPRENIKTALKGILGYRIYRDLRRGWRVTSPNLEQCGLLKIDYESLEDLCRSQADWQGLHPVLAAASSEVRAEVAKTLLDHMRSKLAIKVEFLDLEGQEAIRRRSAQHLCFPWALEENERLVHSAVLFPRAGRPHDPGENVYLSPRGAFGLYLRRPTTFPGSGEPLKLEDTEQIIRQLLETLKIAGLVEAVEPGVDGDPPGYQLPAAALIWRAGDGTTPFHDKIRVPRLSDAGGRTNPFFIEFYRNIAAKGQDLEAREHTAQVKNEDRIEREERFKEARLPILYCSPTMELGVDIAELNAVNLRNIPPTAANYAQRSGRAGRSGQPALVFSYCSTFSSHDQYYFKRPELMVAGAVTPPRLELGNQDLIRAHIQAIWLAATGLRLGSNLTEILDLSGEIPSLELIDRVKDSINSPAARQKTLLRSRRILESIAPELENTDWYAEGWLEEVVSQAPRQLDQACNRWRGLYLAALRQRDQQHRIITDAARSAEDKRKARRLRAEAESQLELLAATTAALNSDFYSYRYFASEGFLPGYNFPRLPLSAYIPGRRQRRQGRDDFLSRPRFLAISEFGPRAIIYHEGSRYRINKVIIPVGDREGEEEGLTISAKRCPDCGYIHPIRQGEGMDLCDICESPLEPPLKDLFRLQNVATKRAERINSDEEERMRIGYELKTALRFAERGGRPSYQSASVKIDDREIARITYGDAATVWRINLGWARRAQPEQHGFMLDLERGYWARNEKDVEDEQDPASERQARVIPYVVDRKNSLIIEPLAELSLEFVASLQAALKNAIQIIYQLEESELAAEPLPDWQDRRRILLYEAAEGGAGVLRQLISSPPALARVAQEALRLCHFDPETGEDQKRAPRASEDCEAACYDCLMSYINQRDHRLLDRKKIRDYLLLLSRSTVEISPVALPRAEHLENLLRQCQSDLERDWLRFLEENDLRLPSRAQYLVEACRTRPDFVYEAASAAIYIDGPHHNYPDRVQRDQEQTDCMKDRGWSVIRFSHRDNWLETIKKHPNLFGPYPG